MSITGYDQTFGILETTRRKRRRNILQKGIRLPPAFEG